MPNSLHTILFWLSATVTGNAYVCVGERVCSAQLWDNFPTNFFSLFKINEKWFYAPLSIVVNDSFVFQLRAHCGGHKMQHIHTHATNRTNTINRGTQCVYVCDLHGMMWEHFNWCCGIDNNKFSSCLCHCSLKILIVERCQRKGTSANDVRYGSWNVFVAFAFFLFFHSCQV